MKLRAWFLIMMSVFTAVLLVTYGKTLADMFTENYMFYMRRQENVSDVRAEGYRDRYQICDQFHNCSTLTSELQENTGERKIQPKMKNAGIDLPAARTVWQ